MLRSERVLMVLNRVCFPSFEKRYRLAGPRAACKPFKGPPLAAAKTDIRGGGQVRSHQLKMGKKVMEDRRRRKEGV